MKNLIIIGAGDFGREVAWLVERINAVQPTWNLLGFIDDNTAAHGTTLDGYPVLGGLDFLRQQSEIFVVCSIGTGKIRRLIMEQAMSFPNVKVATLIDPAVIIGRGASVGAGSIIGANSILAIAAQISTNVIINLGCIIGHDTTIGSYCTINPSSNISGKVQVGDEVDIGTGSKIIQGKTIVGKTILGAGTVVVRDITEPGTYVGVPAKRVNK